MTMTFKQFLSFFISLCLSLPTIGSSAESNNNNNRKGKVQLVESTDSKTKSPAALLFELEYSGDKVLVEFARSTREDFQSASPEQIERIWKATKSASHIGNTIIRFPTETLMFYSVIAFNSMIRSQVISLKNGYETDPAPLKSLENMLKDPVGWYSFLVFMIVNGGINFYGADPVKWSMQVVAHQNAVRLGLLNSKGEALKTEGKEIIKKLGLDRSYHLTTKRIQAALPALGMAFAMSASRIVEHAFHDQNIQICSQGLINNPQANWVEHCRRAYDVWIKDGRIGEFTADFMSLFLAAGSARSILNKAKHFLRQSKSTSAAVLVKGLEFEFGFAPNLEKVKTFSAKLGVQMRKVGNILVKPFSPGNVINTALFLALDGFYSQYTKPIKSAARARELVYELNEIEQKIGGLKASLKQNSITKFTSICDQTNDQEVSWNCFFDRVLGDNRDLADDLIRYSTHLDEFREFQLAEASVINTNWLNATNELISVYQESHNFYKKFLEAKTETNDGLKRLISPFEVRNFLSGTNIYLDNKPIQVDSIDDIVDFEIDRKSVV